ncbi:MAG: 30S ribosomal protein S1 [Alphaproteobacteria bacterium]|nr:30S ribosomal protein S1 [Alphaproteobacteria bacterium]
MQPAAAPAADDDFEALLRESEIAQGQIEGRVVRGSVIAVENDFVVVDIGLKTEGRVPLREFSKVGEEVRAGDQIDVYLERIENALSQAVISRERARREESWNHLEVAFAKNERVSGQIVGRVKGGFTVDLSGALAFLPGSQVDIRPVRDVTPLMGIKQQFQILKMDRRRGNMVVSRRSVLEETRAEQRSELVANLREGQVLEGVVKNITDYGAFVDLGGIDGLLHVTDLSWRRINHPSEALNIGQAVKVQVIKVNPETMRISLGMKQLETDPWEGVAAKYPPRAKFTGRVTNITDYGAFVELEPGVEGLVHVSEMSWTKKNAHPGKIVSTSQGVEVMVLEVDQEKRRISLGLKQCLENPWEGFAARNPVGSAVEGQVRNITEFGLFIGLTDELDGMVHLSDLDWDRPGEVAIRDYHKGDTVKAKVLDIDAEKERISLGVKQLGEDPFAQADKLKKGDVVTCTVAQVMDGGIEVEVAGGLKGFIRRAELSRDRSEQRPDRFAVGDKVDAIVTTFERAKRQLTLSVKAREIREEKEAVEQFGSSDSGASLGDILGAAISRARQQAEQRQQKPDDDEKTDD